MSGRADELIASLAELDLDDAEAEYLYLHSRRYELLLDGLRDCLESSPRPRILDVGPSLQTVLIRRELGAATVDTAGFASRFAAPREGERHFDLDLNRAADPGSRPDLPAYDVVVIAEVIEHLATPPRALLECLAGWLEPWGWLIIQTPNSLALHKRARALAGRNPLGAAGDLSGGSHNPSHFREYTATELTELAEAAGLEPVRVTVANYFRHRSPGRRAYDRLTATLPAGTRQGITAYLRNRR